LNAGTAFADSTICGREKFAMMLYDFYTALYSLPDETIASFHLNLNDYYFKGKEVV
jgi:hypothetical protein